MHCRGIPSVDPHDGEVLILHPDSPGKADALNFRRRRHIKNEASYLAQELPPPILKPIVSLVELPAIDVNHLQESSRIKCPHERAFLAVLSHRVNFESPSKICLTKKIEVRLWGCTRRLVEFQLLDIRFNDRAVKVEGCDLVMFPLEHSIDNLIQLEPGLGSLCIGGPMLCIRGTQRVGREVCLSLCRVHNLQLRTQSSEKHPRQNGPNHISRAHAYPPNEAAFASSFG